MWSALFSKNSNLHTFLKNCRKDVSETGQNLETKLMNFHLYRAGLRNWVITLDLILTRLFFVNSKFLVLFLNNNLEAGISYAFE